MEAQQTSTVKITIDGKEHSQAKFRGTEDPKEKVAFLNSVRIYRETHPDRPWQEIVRLFTIAGSQAYTLVEATKSYDGWVGCFNALSPQSRSATTNHFGELVKLSSLYSCPIVHSANVLKYEESMRDLIIKKLDDIESPHKGGKDMSVAKVINIALEAISLDAYSSFFHPHDDWKWDAKPLKESN